MKIIAKLILFLLFLLLAMVAIFTGGTTGVAGTFYLLVAAADVHQSLILVIVGLTAVLMVVFLLKTWNKKGLKKND